MSRHGGQTQGSVEADRRRVNKTIQAIDELHGVGAERPAYREFVKAP
jgi:hypothetical protein